MRQSLRILAVLQLMAAVAMGIMGFVVSVRPYLLLDVVLSPEELKDPKIHDDTLALMQRAVSYDSAIWLVFAGLVAVLGIFFLRLSSSLQMLETTNDTNRHE